MSNVNVKHILSGVNIFGISLFALLSLTFVLCGYNGYYEYTEIYTHASISTNGFSSIFGINDYYIASEVILVLQIINILLLVMGILCILGSVMFFFIMSKKIAKAVISLSLIATIIYMIEGIVFVSILNYDYSGSGFYTLSYLPFIFVVVLVILYFCIQNFMPDDFKFFSNRISYVDTNAIIKENKQKNEKCSKVSMNIDFNALKELKELFDIGVLTEEEYSEQKRIILTGNR